MTGLTYARAGVDIEAGNALVERLKPLARLTARPGALGGLGGFGAVFDPRAAGFADPLLVATTDGVGTKLRAALEAGRLDGLGQDLVAMCVNDLVCQGAEPLLFLDYFATGRLDLDRAEAIIAGIAHACAAAGCQLAGGETAEMPGLYAEGDFDLAGFALGAVERGRDLPRDVAPGDILLGLASAGIHANGFSLVRRIREAAGLAWDAPAPWGDGSLAEALLAPTRLYVRPVLAAIRAGGVHAAAHVTGGGLPDNLPRVLMGQGARIDLGAWDRPPVFRWLRRAGDVAEDEMLRVFNCGIGFVLIVARDRAEALAALLAAEGETVHSLGEVTAAPGLAVAGAW